MTKQKRLILIDGSGYIFRAYYALPSMSRSDGTPVNALYGFTNMLVKLIEDYGDEKLIVIFDAARENFRNKIYSEYKANRGDTPDDLIPQFDLIKKCVEAFKIPQLEINGYEADDIIATYSKLAKKQDIQSLIISSDKDLMQLINDKVNMLDPIKNKHIGFQEVIDKFGVEPEKVIQVQALMGDSTDNIPGAPGIGPKTAAELINKFGDIESLIKKHKEIKQQKRQQIIEEHKENIRISLELVRLKQDIKLPVSIDEIVPYKKNSNDPQSIIDFLNKQGFKTVLKRLEGNSFIFDKEKTKDKPNHKRINYQKISDIKELQKLIKKITEVGLCAIDTETDSLNIDKVKLVGISLCFNNLEAFYIPITHKELNTNKMCKNQIDLKSVIEQISILCANPSILKIGQNIKYDIRVLQKYNVKFNSIADTMLMSYAFENGIVRHNMDDLALKHLDHVTIKFKELVGSGKKQITFDYVDISKATEYAAEDAYITFKLYNIFNKNISKEKNNFIYSKIDMPLIDVLSSMEKNGVKIDEKYLNNLSAEFSKQINLLESKIYKITKKEFNIGSPKQLGEILFDEMGIKGAKKTKTGSYSTDSSILEELSLDGEEIAKLILNWRELSKLKSTYTDSLINQISTITGRVHTSYALASTITGRLSSNDPNLQNIPIRTENGKKIRKAFIPKKDTKLVSFDYSQIELRLAAEISEDSNLIKAFKNNEDIHTLTASQVFNLDIKKVDQNIRRKAKAINFGIIYGISQYGLAKQIMVSINEAEEFLTSYFLKFPEIKEYMNSTIKFCRKSGYVNNIFGRRTHINGINDKNYNVRNFQERAAINAPIQGSASEIMRLAMIRLVKRFKSSKDVRSKILLQIHDELIFEVPNTEIKEVCNVVKEEMISVAKSDLHAFSIPLTVDVNSGDNWGILH